MSEELHDNCPKCGGQLHRDSVDVGVGMMYGPFGCVECGWSEDDACDLSEGRNPIDERGGAIDQFGGYYPARSLCAALIRSAKERH